jgi:hypothetical protein
LDGFKKDSMNFNPENALADPGASAFVDLFELWHVSPVAVVVGVFRKTIPSFKFDFLRVVDIAACFANFNINTIIRCLLSGTELMTLTHLPSSFIKVFRQFYYLLI